MLQANLLYGAAASKKVSAALLELIAAGIVQLYCHEGQEWVQIIDYDERLSDHTIKNRPDPDSPAPPASEGMTVAEVANVTVEKFGQVVQLHAAADPVKTPDEVNAVFEHWKEVEERTGGIKAAKLTEGRRKRIAARLSEGYTVEQAMAEAHRCLTCQDPVCEQGCPVRAAGSIS